jgi:hypothetical protein
MDIVETKVENDGLELDAVSIVVRRIRPGSSVQGLRAKLDGYLGRSRIRFQVDVGLGEKRVRSWHQTGHRTVQNSAANRRRR